MRTIAGKPLLRWTLDECLKVPNADDIIVSSDDPIVLALQRHPAYQELVRFSKRPPQLASDTATTKDVLAHIIRSEFETGNHVDAVVLLQPTSPLRVSEDVIAAINQFEACDAERPVISVSAVDYPLQWTGSINKMGRLEGFCVDQNLPATAGKDYRLNGAIYVLPIPAKVEKLEIDYTQAEAYVMPRERSIDIDTLSDFVICEALLRARRCER